MRELNPLRYRQCPEHPMRRFIYKPQDGCSLCWSIYWFRDWIYYWWNLTTPFHETPRNWPLTLNTYSNGKPIVEAVTS